jgi:prophage regulatory protein
MDHIIRLPEVKALTKLSRSTIYRLANEGEFPAPVALGPRAVGWKNAAVLEWLHNRPSKLRRAA